MIPVMQVLVTRTYKADKHSGEPFCSLMPLQGLQQKQLMCLPACPIPALQDVQQ